LTWNAEEHRQQPRRRLGGSIENVVDVRAGIGDRGVATSASRPRRSATSSRMPGVEHPFTVGGPLDVDQLIGRCVLPQRQRQSRV